MSNNIVSLNHASFIVADTVVSLVFYCEVLGLQAMERPDMGFPGAWIQLGQGPEQIHLLELNNPDPIAGRPQHGGRDRHIALNALALEPIQEVVRDLNQVLCGWSGYFHYRNSSLALSKVKRHAEERLRIHLRKRHKVSDWKTSVIRFPRRVLYEEYGLYKVPTVTGWKSAHALM